MRNGREAGLSLIELVMVCLIIAIIAGIAVPNLVSASRSYKLQIASQALSQQLNLTRQEAVRRNNPVSIIINEHTSQVDSEPDDDAAGLDDLFTFSQDVKVMNVPTGGIVVRFTSRGEIPTGTTPPTLQLRLNNSNQYARNIVVSTRGSITIGSEYTP